MAVIPVNLTSESFHHLMQVLEAAIDTSVAPIKIKPPFLPLVKAIHQMVVLASTDPGLVPTEAIVGGKLQITLPKVLDPIEQKMVDHLDMMVDACADSIKDANATSKIVLEV